MGMVKFKAFQKVRFVHGKPEHEWGTVRGWEFESDGALGVYLVECVCGHMAKYSEHHLEAKEPA